MHAKEKKAFIHRSYVTDVLIVLNSKDQITTTAPKSVIPVRTTSVRAGHVPGVPEISKISHCQEESYAA
jgi:hypothetical protein